MPIASDALPTPDGMLPPREAACHALIAAFVARRIELAEFMRRFESQWLRGDRSDRQLTSIRALCSTYTGALAADAGYRVSEAQLRLEIRGIVAALPVPARPVRLSPG